VRDDGKDRREGAPGAGCDHAVASIRAVGFDKRYEMPGFPMSVHGQSSSRCGVDNRVVACCVWV
jgi:hypothetical protein